MANCSIASRRVEVPAAEAEAAEVAPRIRCSGQMRRPLLFRSNYRQLIVENNNYNNGSSRSSSESVIIIVPYHQQQQQQKQRQQQRNSTITGRIYRNGNHSSSSSRSTANRIDNVLYKSTCIAIYNHDTKKKANKRVEKRAQSKQHSFDLVDSSDYRSEQ